MKTIIALALSTLFIHSAYAEQSTIKNSKNINIPNNNMIDDTNRKAILEALGATSGEVDESKKISQINDYNKSKQIIKKSSIDNTIPNSEYNKTNNSILKNEVSEIKKEEIKQPIKIINAIPVIKKDKIIVEQQPTKLEVTILEDKKIKKNNEQAIKEMTLLPPAEKQIINPKLSKNVVKPRKKIIIKKTTNAVISNEITLVKPPHSISEKPYDILIKDKIHYLNRNEVISLFTINYLNDMKLINFKLSSLINVNLEKEQFNIIDNSFINGYIVSNDLKNITKINIIPEGKDINYNFHMKNTDVCQAIFVQYQLKAEEKPQTFVHYIDSQGNLSSILDSQCSTPNFNSKESLDYSEDNTSGIFMNNLTNKGSLKYTIINYKNGVAFIPDNLNSYIIDKNFKTIYNAHKISKNNISSSIYLTDVFPGSYYVIGEFNNNNNNKKQSIVTEAIVN